MADKNIDKSIDYNHNQPVEFDWGDEKHAINLQKHKVDFAHVLVAFEDFDRKIAIDDRRNYGEIRYNMLAKIHGRVFHITFTERGPITWLISARKANKKEQKRYERA